MYCLRILFFLLPAISGLANVFQLFKLPQSVLVIIPIALLALSFFEMKKVKVNTTKENKFRMYMSIICLYAYTIISSFYVFIADGAYDLKNSVIILINIIPLVWIAFYRPGYTIDLNNLMKIYVYSTLIMCFLFLLFCIPILLINGSKAWAFISMNVIPNRNDSSIIMLIALSALFFLNTFNSVMLRIVFSSIIVISILLTFSRSAYLCVAALVLFYSIRSGHFLRYSVLIGCVAILLIFTDNPISDRLFYTFESGNVGKYDDSTSLRFQIWDYALSKFSENPVFGVGFGKGPFFDTLLDAKYSNSILYAHNYYITQLYQLGIIGFSLSLLTFFYMAKSALGYISSHCSFIISIVIIFSVASFSGEPLYGYPKYVFFVIYCLLMNNCIQRESFKI